MINISESINVWVFFKGNIIQPHSFYWHSRQIKVDKINLVHTSKNGAWLFYHFSITSGGNFYRLRFDAHKLNWILEAVEEDN